MEQKAYKFPDEDQDDEMQIEIEDFGHGLPDGDIRRALFEPFVTTKPPGKGTGHHLAMELFGQRLNLSLLHVPHSNMGAAVTNIAGGHVHMMFAPTASVLPLASSGKIRPLAVMTGSRAKVLPDLPTVAEQGIADFSYLNWTGYFAPRATPAPVLARLNGSPAYRAIHRSILAGLLGNIARLDEENGGYKATHDRRVTLFPGSVLFRREEPRRCARGRGRREGAPHRHLGDAGGLASLTASRGLRSSTDLRRRLRQRGDHCGIRRPRPWRSR